jgi:hypothetical protein
VKARMLVLCIIATGVVLVGASPANAGATVVRGTQTPVGSGPCFHPEADFSTVMSGSLVGCWWGTFVLDNETPSGVITAHGNETFAGCLDTNLDGNCAGEPTGTFGTSYTFTSKYDANGAEIHGRCQHPVGDGTGGFSGASGVINFTDDVTLGVAYYFGPILIR